MLFEVTFSDGSVRTLQAHNRQQLKMALDNVKLINPALKATSTESVKTITQERNMKKPTIVCLCGSTRFSRAFHEANLKETLAGRIVLSIGCDFKSDTDLLLAGELTEQDKTRLDELHLCKIALADEVLVLNVGGYVGQSTQREIDYAMNNGKHIRWLESGFQQYSLDKGDYASVLEICGVEETEA